MNMCSTYKDRPHIESTISGLPVAAIKTCNSCNYNELTFKLYVLLVVDSSQCSEPHCCYDRDGKVSVV